MGCKADFAANSTAIGKKFNAADRPSPGYHGPRGVMQRVLKYRLFLLQVIHPICDKVPMTSKLKLLIEKGIRL